MASRVWESLRPPEVGFEIFVTFNGINDFCPPDGPCVPQGEGEFGWKDLRVMSPNGRAFTIQQLSWPEAEMPGIIKAAQKAFRKNRAEFRLKRRPHELVVRQDQIPTFIEGLTAFLEHQENCPNRRCP